MGTYLQVLQPLCTLGLDALLRGSRRPWLLSITDRDRLRLSERAVSSSMGLDVMLAGA